MSGVVAAPRRNEALAYIIERIVRTGTSPSAGDIGRQLKVSRTRAQQLVDELVREGVITKVPGSHSLRIRDLIHCRHIIVENLRALGVISAEPMGELLGSGLIGHSQKMTVAARAMAEKKTVGHRS